ncbi:MAG: SIMPL domain-containing protein [Hydrococcus sp. C42_A2020_068]|nr:SIMPL domain-containing protein [Hydrococcus sp. C42_A2020_068]
MAILLVILSIASSAPAIAQEKILRILTVTGQGQETIPTSLAQVQLGVEVKGQTAQEVQQEIARRSSAVVELLRSRGVEKLQTTGIQLQPAYYDYSSNQQRLVGYVGVNTISFRISNDRVGNLLDEAVKAGATRIDSVDFTASDNAIAAAQKQALRLATEDAQQQADTVLSALNLTRQEIVNIQVNGASTPPPQPLMAREAARTDSATTPVIGGEQTVSASVTLQISY